MTYNIYNSELNTEIVIDETLCQNVSICITEFDLMEGNKETTHYLNPKQLHDLIGALLHIQAKKRKA